MTLTRIKPLPLSLPLDRRIHIIGSIFLLQLNFYIYVYIVCTLHTVRYCAQPALKCTTILISFSVHFGVVYVWKLWIYKEEGLRVVSTNVVGVLHYFPPFFRKPNLA
jgi:hypothetical protein